jgi:hypothetical protein
VGPVRLEALGLVGQIVQVVHMHSPPASFVSPADPPHREDVTV